jgi:AcrR family transcriptional regulator
VSAQAVTEKGGETRQRIIDAAADCFMQRGYAGTSMSDLIAAAGLTKGGFYFHFASKRDVAVEVVRTRQEAMRAEVFATAGEHDRASDQIVAMVRALPAAIQSKMGGGVAGLERFCKDLVLAGADDPAVVQPLRPWVDTTEQLFRWAQEQGDMTRDVDARTAAVLAVGAFCGLEDLARGNPDTSEALGMTVDEYLTFIARAVGLSLDL